MISKEPTPNPGMSKMGSEPPQGTAVGSGSRPTTSRMPIATSTPEDPHTLGRAPAGWLK